jgi:hypothetical protein
MDVIGNLKIYSFTTQHQVLFGGVLSSSLCIQTGDHKVGGRKEKRAFSSEEIGVAQIDLSTIDENRLNPRLAYRVPTM